MSKDAMRTYVDQITTQAMVVPTLSPDYFVLDYSTWIALLRREEKNPFTMREMTEKDLIILTEQNFEKYRDKIANLEESLPNN